MADTATRHKHNINEPRAAKPSLSPSNCEVFVLGAGITGLTAAHELVRRGFIVKVIEQHHGSPVSDFPEAKGNNELLKGINDVDVGGIARTQWATAPKNSASHVGRSFATVSGLGSSEPFKAVDPYSYRVIYDVGLAEGQPWIAIRYDARGRIRLGRAAIKRLNNSITQFKAEAVQLVALNYRLSDDLELSSGHPLEPILGPEAAYRRLAAAARGLDQAFPKPSRPILPVACVEVVLDCPRYVALANELREKGRFPGVSVRYHFEQLVPGEHGYRFFAGFYRHLRRTMTDIRLTEPDLSSWDGTTLPIPKRFNERTATDNLREVRWQVIADPTRDRPAAFRRKPFPTLVDAINQYDIIRRDLGIRGSDLLRFFLRLARYASSCSQRRTACYEDLSWYDFVTLRDLRFAPRTTRPSDPLPYGRRALHMIKHSPEALVAMRSKATDARTHGNLSLQLALDQFGRHEQTDSTLIDATSVAWLDRWKEFLKIQGVEFRAARVTKISRRSFTYVDTNGSSTALPFGTPSSGHQRYVVCALDAVNASRVMGDLAKALEVEDAPSDYLRHAPSRLIELVRRERPEDIRRPRKPRKKFQVLTGIQYYYEQEASFADGHIYFALSPWGLSAVSQVQYWRAIKQQPPTAMSRLRGILSVDIGSWRGSKVPPWAHTKENPPPCPRYGHPSRFTRDQIAALIDGQVRWGMGRVNSKRFVGPFVGYHIDDHILFERCADGGVRPRWNTAPFLTNVVGKWRERPLGEPWSPNHCDNLLRRPGDGSYHRERAAKAKTPDLKAIWCRNDGVGYPVYYDGLVFAGPHMRTFTRMNTMEAANESARHAVNAILDHLTFLQNEASPGPLTEGGGFKPQGPPPLSESEPGAQQVLARTEPLAAMTPNGDYCDIYDPEEHEFVEFQFLKEIDEHLFEMSARNTTEDVPLDTDDEVGPRRPHLFDILELDRLPDLMDEGEDAVEIWRAVAAALESIDRSSVDDLVRWSDASRAWVRSTALDSFLSGLANPKTRGLGALRSLVRLLRKTSDGIS
jgi:hypothetical protein